jgi:2-C-methyl-D-erythritol 4-phosphate cytidylyltransferase
MNIGVILAGGVGSRLGADIPKQFIKVLDKPILAYTIEVFQEHPMIDVIEVVCHKQWKDYLQEMVKEYGLTKVRWIADGGETFMESVQNGAYYLSDKVARDDILLYHFGASPFVTEDLITDAIRVCKEKGNAISTTDYYLLSAKKKYTSSVTDPENYTDEYIDRDTIAVMNSPHAFKFGVIKDIYDEAIATGVINEVEPHTTTMMFKMNIPIYFSKGSQMNIKITRKEDLDIFEGYVLMKQKRAQE